MKPTDEQMAAVAMAAKLESFKVMAYAGAGKTSTLKLIGTELSHYRGLYLAFNKAIASEAAAKFGSNVQCMTFHSLAYRSSPKWLTAKLSNKRIFPEQLAMNWGLDGYELPTDPAKRKTGNDATRKLSARNQAVAIENAVANFASSTEQEPTAQHVWAALPDWIEKNTRNELAKVLEPYAKKHWRNLIDRNDRSKIGHDVYLKYWALNDPYVSADFILFDEAQDADPIILGVLEQQRHAQIIYVGDAHQQIYSWRGAVNAMQSLQLPTVKLSQSFRFGDAIAEQANLIICNLLGETVPLRGLSSIADSVASSEIDDPDAILCRTNAKAFATMIEQLSMGKTASLEANTAEIARFIDQSIRLQAGLKADHPELEAFANWTEVTQYCAEYPRAEIAPLVNLINKNDPRQLLHVARNSGNRQDADVIVCTAHKSKGLEFGRVQLADDYFYKTEGAFLPVIDEDESRLMYVAVTRAKHVLDVTKHGKFFELLGAKLH